jgi:hypothetical protein
MMIRVELTNVSLTMPLSKTVIEIPDDQWAHMTDPDGLTGGGIARNVTRAFDGTRVVVDVHAGGTVIVFRETRPCDTCNDEALPGKDTCQNCDPFAETMCAVDTCTRVATPGDYMCLECQNGVGVKVCPLCDTPDILTTGDGGDDVHCSRCMPPLPTEEDLPHLYA